MVDGLLGDVLASVAKPVEEESSTNRDFARTLPLKVAEKFVKALIRFIVNATGSHVQVTIVLWCWPYSDREVAFGGALSWIVQNHSSHDQQMFKYLSGNILKASWRVSQYWCNHGNRSHHKGFISIFTYWILILHLDNHYFIKFVVNADVIQAFL